MISPVSYTTKNCFLFYKEQKNVILICSTQSKELKLSSAVLIKFLSVLAKSFPFKIVTILAENQLVGLYSVTDRDIIEKLFCAKLWLSGF